MTPNLPQELIDEDEATKSRRKKRDLDELSESANKMKIVYSLFLKEMQALVGEETDPETGKLRYDFRELFQVYDMILDRTRFIKCCYESSRVAVNIVMSQTRGKNPELVDSFKMLVCRHKQGNDSPEDQDKNVMRWEELCEKKGRKTVETVCLLVVQYTLGKQLRQNSNERTLRLFEEFVRAELQSLHRGEAVFESLEQAVCKYQCFHKCPHSSDLFPHLSDGNKAALIPSLDFLCLSLQLTHGQEMEAVILYVLVEYQDFDNLQDVLSQLESVVLWMVLCKPPRKIRLLRAFQILEELKEPLALSKAIKLTRAEKEDVLHALKTFSVDKPVDTKVAKYVLKRLNLHVAATAQQETNLDTVTHPVYLERIIDGDSRLFNFVVTTTKPSKYNTVEKKKRRFRDCPYPLTNDIADLTVWSSRNLKPYWDRTLAAAATVWGLPGALKV